ncbi:ROK family protein [Rhizobium sp. KVB221]|uniref:ROK family protein n=1 Tax=Rhizobium setariae TaxID=2801340 RepID=A0A936YT86_9HYPH|nr:ROK family protein [Rhizobium setariae]MBL0372312.1 ROK family protein [Rhizobium setariae]
MILCFDIGGSWIKSAVARSADDIAIGDKHPTPLEDFAAFADILKAKLDGLPERPQCVAISMTGVVDPDSGVITCANIPCIDQRRLAGDLEARLGVPVLVANDADCFVLAEAGQGAGRNNRIVLGIILGSGVGGGLVVDGRLANAAGGFAGEWGHGPIIAQAAGDPPVAIPAYPCTCGQKGCVNTVGGARGLERLHGLIHGVDLPSTEIVAGWEADEPNATRTVDVYVDLLSSPLALAINITGATIVPAGGGLANSAALLTEIDKTVRNRILRRFDRPLIVRAQCDIEPGLVGAAMLGLEHIRNGVEH